jgi:hypothetical protein
VFFVSVASKRVSWTVSLLFATLTGRFINVAAKGLRDGEIESPEPLGIFD